MSFPSLACLNLKESRNCTMAVEDKSDIEGSTEKIDTGVREIEYPSITKVIVVILALYLAVFLVALDQTIIGVAIPKITDQFKSIEDIAWYGSAYFLTSTALQPSYGRIYKIFSVSKPLIWVSNCMGPALTSNRSGQMGFPDRCSHL